MLALTLAEMRVVVAALLVVCVVFVPMVLWFIWRQEVDSRQLRQHLGHLDADVAELWECVFGGPGPGGGDGPDDPDGPRPLADEPDTAIAHPADTWARKQSLLARYSTHGQHRL